jgi:hypothetical protein
VGYNILDLGDPCWFLSKVLCSSLTTNSSSGLFFAPESNLTMAQQASAYNMLRLDPGAEKRPNEIKLK